MVLKSLLIQGFKSFPDKTEITFVDGMTAIVGPNGSGKSNISDAIRWVLGEQSSRSLRGSKMEDVIFGGTAKRGPVGFAEVSLILDNENQAFRSEFTEIMVTRRYYRSGESEYFLNKKHCRLKDIHELFMDTGLGRDGYSSIGQGRIDEILSLKSEDRREIFEEAAGITKFRYRKEEAERKLSATEDNLTRIRDLYEELARQIGPLEKQAEKAKEYLILRDELRVLEISLWLVSLSRIKLDMEKLVTDTQTCSAQLNEAKENQQKLYQTSEKLLEDMRNVDRETDRLRAQLREIEQRASEQASRVAVIKANIKNNEENIERTKRENYQREEQINSLTTQLEERKNRIAVLEIEHETLKKKRESFSCDMETQKERQSLAEEALHKAEINQLESREENHRIALEQTAARAGLSGMDERRDTIDSDIKNAKKRIEIEQSEQVKLQNELTECLTILDSAKNKTEGISLKAENRRAKVQNLQDKFAKITAEQTDCQNRIKMLEDMQKDYEGFSRSVKTIMSRKESGILRGVHGPVSSLIETDTKYVTAIDTALGGSASSIVVDSSSVGKSCIEYLKKTDGGRATFLPIDTIRPSSLKESGLEKIEGCFGTADRLVHSRKEYTAIVQNLLARTVVSENMDSALKLAKAYGNRFRIVTLDGQILQAGGAMTGGSMSRGTGALARAGKLKTLRENKEQIESQKNEITEEFTAAKEELAALEYDLNAIKAERIRAEQDEAGLRASVLQHKALLESLQIQYDGYILEQTNLVDAKRKYEETILLCGEKLRESEEKQKAAAAKTEKCREDLQKIRLESTENTAKYAQTQTEIAENRSEAASEQRAVQDLERLKTEMAEGVSGTDEMIFTFQAEIEQLKAELISAENAKEDTGLVTAEIAEKIAAQSSQRERIEGERTAAEKQAQSKNEEILNLEREAARLENRSVQMKNEETQILDKMWENYELTPTPAAEVAIQIENHTEAKEKAKQLRTRMKSLGNVNLDAVEEYKETAERYTFMGEQKSDLEKAQSELYKIIDQLTVNMKEIFASEFAKLNAYFGETFHEIFGGGHAELALADTSDILNCGIDIRVSPPGKAVKTLSLLSGGEKAFVAIALYFAILKLRPTPFCVLDEIEAALDDVNVVRYAQYIRKLSDKTQFIVITHRRGTMEEADMLYGVTMQEQGVSKLLMLNLAEAEKRLGSAIR